MLQKWSFPKYQKLLPIFLGGIVFASHQNNLLGGTIQPRPEKSCSAGKMQTSTNLQNPFFVGFCLRRPNPGAMPCSATEACDCTERCCWDRFFQVRFGRTFEITWRIGPPHLGYVLSKGARITRLNLLRGRKLIMVIKHLQVMGRSSK